MPAAQPLLLELFTEELPPKALNRLGQAFAEGIAAGLKSRGLLAEGSTATAYATPRRLAVRLSAVLPQGADSEFSEKLMPVSVGLDANGQPTPALLKKLASKGLEGVDVSGLARESDGKNEQLVYRGIAKGAALAPALQAALEDTLGKLPIPKVMSYQLADGVTTVRFVRPAHGLVALHGDTVVDISALGLRAGRNTRGHRFQSQATIELPSADAYEALLHEPGRVIASFEQRRAAIERQLRDQAERLQSSLGDEADVASLLDEVCALVEYPTVYVGEFESEFLAVPQECLILTMRLNQKYFPLFDAATGKLTHRFLIVSNMALANPSNIVEGNQRVVRPRLADARFFFETDKKVPLAQRVEQLATVVYHNKLGTQLERAQRVRALARWVAGAIGADPERADRAALLAKADLVTGMVGEFPELQGVMGAYYAAADGEAPDVVEAIRQQYRIRLDRPVDADGATAAALFVAERAETLLGIWSIGLVPTGDKDPYGLRRAALGLISAFEQLDAGGRLPADGSGLTLDGLLARAAETFATPPTAAQIDEVRAFVFERYRNQLAGQFDRAAVDAVVAVTPPLAQVPARVRAVVAFSALPEAAALAAANKRIGNLLKKVEGEPGAVDEALLKEPAEQALAQAVRTLRPQAEGKFAQGDFGGALTVLSQAREPVDAFFADVMVMAEDPAVRANRLALLAELHRTMNHVADLSRLATA
ncbi:MULTISPECIES: glycine--tRNA ligase subunit beta [unclassified Pigmentiphaga]|uniref:glycine--tRNA ligase subunit beta n=1 Tax=unclassified Pigmentiphaga TaxID=2626614 RepID=UPI000B40AE8C|nr:MULTISPECIES: glycine--tRNA ligase subunit beta [unclassified Pigmentiphaga]OVZ64991.1 glycine--tRNA ligase subunit beta [Pigmentiphaga sp. NML030171]